MADRQIGSIIGVPAVGWMETKLAGISADGANTVTVDDLRKIIVGMSIDILVIADGSALASARTVTSLTSAGVLTYSGADVTAVAGTHGVYVAGVYNPGGTVNINGGLAQAEGWHDYGALQSLAAMRARLTAIDSGYYTAARLNSMTMNDMVYAIRLADDPGSIN